MLQVKVTDLRANLTMTGYEKSESIGEANSNHQSRKN